MITPFIYPNYPAMMAAPWVLSDTLPVGQQWVGRQALNDYYSTDNISKNLAANVGLRAMLTPSSDGDYNPVGGVVAAGATYAGIKIFGKVFNAYKHGVERYDESHPGWADFKNQHPFIGGALTWTPAVTMAGGVTAGAGALSLMAAKTGLAKRVYQSAKRNPVIATLAGGLLLGGALVTSFWGKLFGRTTESVDTFAQAYRQARKDHKEMSPKELKQYVKAGLNQKRYALMNNPTRLQQDLDPYLYSDQSETKEAPSEKAYAETAQQLDKEFSHFVEPARS